MESDTLDLDSTAGKDVYSPPLAEGALSPSLRAGRPEEAPAYEMKFVLTADVADEIAAWAGWRLKVDPHGDPALDGAYRTTTVYLDTEADDVRHRRGWHRRHKLRLRRYGEEPWVYVEQKTKRRDQVTKQRSRVAVDELPRLAEPPGDPAWSGAWFAERAGLRGLRPAAMVQYRRAAYLGDAGGPVRLTLDRDLSCRLATGWSLEGRESGQPFLEGRALMELKYHEALPGIFKDLIAELRLSPRGASKYRLGLDALDGDIDA